MISRHWRGLANPAHADQYVQRGVEFLIVTTWESIEAIEHFAGRDSEIAVVPEKVQRMMLEYDRWARHYEVLTHAGHSACSSYAMFA
jgi:heme-degrading monooxygenase HmoA